MKKLLSFLLVAVFALQAFGMMSFGEISPYCTGMTMSGYTSTLTFANTGDGLQTTNSTNNALSGFSVLSCGEWVTPDSARIASADTVVVEHSDTYTLVRYTGNTLCSSTGALVDGFTRQAQRSTTNKTINAAVTGLGYDIYTPHASSGYAYQYGPSSIVYPDGQIDVWFASLGSSASQELDYISYIHSSDGGTTWSNRKIVLSPTPLSKDRYSCCDPGVIYFGGYYYIGYTSTLDHSGYANSMFVARSTNPDGPYEKWNGSGWGGDPAPVILFEGNGNQWGIGEPAFVELDGRLYIYYTRREWLNTTQNIENYTMVAVADASNPNWPATVREQGIALNMGSSQSGTDVKYHEQSGKFIAMAVVDSRSATSSMLVYESSDGLRFTQVDRIYTNMIYYAHNNGMSGSPNGHIVEGDQTFVTYAYGKTWGHWATRLAPVQFTLANSADTSDSSSNLNKTAPGVKSENYVMGITTANHYYIKHVSDGAFKVTVYAFSNSMGRSAVSDTSNVTFTDYNSSIVSFNGIYCTPLSTGTTDITANYQGHKVTFKVVVRPENQSTTYTTLASWVPYKSEMTIEVGAGTQPQIRGIATTFSGVYSELFNNEVKDSYDIDYSTDYPVTYTGYNANILYVSPQGILVPFAAGTTNVTATVTATDSTNNVTNTKSFTVRVKIVNPKTYTMTLDTNGGYMGAAKEYYFNYGDKISSVFTSGLPTPVRAGYNFVEWYNEDNDFDLSTSSTYTYPLSSNLVYKAQWTPAETYQVTYNANGGTGAPAAQTKYIDTELTLSSSSPSKDGYRFLGWALDPNATTPDYNPGAKYSINASMTLYAVYELQSDPPYITSENYTVTVHNIEGIYYIRYASGTYPNLTELKKAPDIVGLNSGTIAKGVANGVFTHELPTGGTYTFWIRYNDGRTFLLYPEVTNFTPTVSNVGLNLTVSNLYGFKDYFIASGYQETYRQCADNKLARISVNGIGDAKSYTWTVPGNGEYTVCIRYADPTHENVFLHINIDILMPVITVNGLQVTLENLDQIRVVRTAPGTWTTTGQIKRAEGNRNFTAKTLKSKDPYVVQYYESGPYSISLEYYNGIVVVQQIDIQKKEPVISVSGRTVTFTQLTDLYIIRYAPGTWTTSAQIKRATGAKIIRPSQVVNDTVSVTLAPGTYTFAVQYDEESITVRTIVIE